MVVVIKEDLALYKNKETKKSSHFTKYKELLGVFCHCCLGVQGLNRDDPFVRGAFQMDTALSMCWKLDCLL